jgi:Xaa-Pro aminopeptidase
LKPGHVVTNEPGFYDEGKFGCRIESTIVAVKKKVHPPSASYPVRYFVQLRNLRRCESLAVIFGWVSIASQWWGLPEPVFLSDLILRAKIPIQSKLVDFSLLTKEETAWLDAHNKLSYEKLRPLLKKVGDKRALALLGKFF